MECSEMGTASSTRKHGAAKGPTIESWHAIKSTWLYLGHEAGDGISTLLGPCIDQNSMCQDNSKTGSISKSDNPDSGRLEESARDGS